MKKNKEIKIEAKRKGLQFNSTTYNSKNPLIRHYFNKKLNTAIKFADLKENDLVLDFGCGQKNLKTKLSNKNIKYVGYDKNKELTEIDDFRKIKPKVIIAINVLEYFTKEELNELIDDFIKMRPRLIVSSFPKISLLAKIITKLLRTHSYIGDKLNYKDFDKIMSNRLKKVKQKTIYGNAVINVWQI